MSIPETRNAIAINRPGDVDVLEKVTIPFKHRPSEIVVKNEYFGINFLDTYIRRSPYWDELPAVMGIEAAGTIVALPTDERILNNPGYKKRGYTVGSRFAVLYQVGAHADYVALPWSHLHVLPEAITTKIGAAAILQGLTALTFVERAYAVKKGDTILVHTVAGGTGLALAQFIKARGGIVIGTTSTPEKAELAKAHGADHVILYKNEDTVKRVLELTNGVGVDAVFDGVGKDTFDNNFKLLKRNGTFVSLGNLSGGVPASRRFPNYLQDPDEVYRYTTELWKTITDGKFKVPIHREYPFTALGMQQAQTDLVRGKTAGKVLVKVE
ncbi:NAD(P)-binding protein [Mycena amicta]|nr:NAD(P)-binding protein [Mycena amicta]